MDASDLDLSQANLQSTSFCSSANLRLQATRMNLRAPEPGR